ncbi:hypothetical protein [Aquibacillus rhizosphaerae]|uniref:Heme ABC transporter n=1 Tax=Aquibacillus rhizosphaerae TaxID=3051431 RepID=A0ABT7L6F4_9BACI|nr:hypothetical protein [Aquibacillus sp. LR5S19]MDL4840186.1 hypothetical protein [Aquibacillus sp. LR5S19]
MTKTNHSEDEQSKNNIEVWEDLVNIKDLVLSLFICSFTTLTAYFIAPNEPPQPLFYGLIGALIGFGICSYFIKPKRSMREAESEE